MALPRRIDASRLLCPSLPAPPRADCKRAARWQQYYQSRADYYTGMADALAGHPESQQFARNEARRYEDGVDEIKAGTHFRQLSGDWT